MGKGRTQNGPQKKLNEKSEKRRRWTAKRKIDLVLEGIRAKISVAELCRREGIAASVYYKWSKAYLGAG